MSNDVVRIFDVEEEIWPPTPEEREKKGNLLTVEEQRGTIQMDLTTPLELTDGEPVDHLLVRAPRQKQVQAFQSERGDPAKREVQFFGGCCLGIKPDDVENLHSRDWSRLGRLVSFFTV